jgi:hypothetical protein
MERTRAATDGWVGRTDRPLGAIPFAFAGTLAAIIANVFTNSTAIAVLAWTVFAVSALVLAARGVMWVFRQREAILVERETVEMLRREPRLVPLFRTGVVTPHDYFHKAS